MAKTSKKSEVKADGLQVEAAEPVVAESAAVETELPPCVDGLMRLYPQYEEFWVTPKGFVHQVGVPEYLLKGATLYKNKYYKQ